MNDIKLFSIENIEESAEPSWKCVSCEKSHDKINVFSVESGQTSSRRSPRAKGSKACQITPILALNFIIHCRVLQYIIKFANNV